MKKISERSIFFDSSVVRVRLPVSVFQSAGRYDRITKLMNKKLADKNNSQKRRSV
jgi:hypothetical protein